MSSTDQPDVNDEVDESKEGKKYPWIFYFAIGFMGATVAIYLSKMFGW